MTINTKLSAKRCRDMVNRIQLGSTPEEIRRRCRIAEDWLKANEVITISEFDKMMEAVAFLHRESYRYEA